MNEFPQEPSIKQFNCTGAGCWDPCRSEGMSVCASSAPKPSDPECWIVVLSWRGRESTEAMLPPQLWPQQTCSSLHWQDIGTDLRISKWKVRDKADLNGD
jgi:hypothetical protein